MSFKSPINSAQQLMAITAEECGELTQVCMKHMRKNKTIKDIINDEKFHAKLVEEVGDVYCMIDLMVSYDILTWDDIEKRANVKHKKLKQWSTIAK
jgi:NTP pyrophosphatase (non-canonical NTP hydrolase)